MTSALVDASSAQHWQVSGSGQQFRLGVTSNAVKQKKRHPRVSSAVTPIELQPAGRVTVDLTRTEAAAMWVQCAMAWACAVVCDASASINPACCVRA